MSEGARQESPLVQFLAARRSASRPEDAGVYLCERPFPGQLNVRGDPSDHAFLDAVEGVLGLGLRLEPNTVSEGDELSAMWLGPDEWLVLTPPGREVDTALALRDALGSLFASVTDVSGAQTVINVSGARARDLLQKGCSADLHPRVFGPGRCAQALIAKAGVTVRQLDDSPSFDLIVRRSFAEYLALWLEDAAQEYGVAVAATPTG